MACRGGLSGIVVALGMAVGVAQADGLEAYCPALKWVLRAPPGDPRVQVIDVSRGITPLATLQRPRRGRVLAVEVQVASRQVWVLADDGLDVHDAFNGRLLGHWPVRAGARLDHLVAAGDGRLMALGGVHAYVPKRGGLVPVVAPLRQR